MNYVVITGVVSGEPIQEITKDGILTIKFNIRNEYYATTKQIKETTHINCISYGNIARYCNNEIYDGAKVLITGRIVRRHYFINGTHIDKQYISCTNVARLDQEDYGD